MALSLAGALLFLYASVTLLVDVELEHACRDDLTLRDKHPLQARLVLSLNLTVLVDLIQDLRVIYSEACDSDCRWFKRVALSELEDALLELDLLALRQDGRYVCPVLLRLQHCALLI